MVGRKSKSKKLGNLAELAQLNKLLEETLAERDALVKELATQKEKSKVYIYIYIYIYIIYIYIYI